MKKALIVLAVFLMLTTFGSCSKTSEKETTKDAAAQSTAATTEKATDITTAAETVFTNDLLVQGMNAVDSYNRVSKITDTYETGESNVDIYTYAMTRSPLSEQSIMDLVSADAYDESITIEDTFWTRSEKDGVWQKYLAGEWGAEKPLEFHYNLKTIDYPIDYGKLTFKETGKETVNDVACTRYVISGSYKDDNYVPDQGTDKMPLEIAVTGNVWISDGSSVEPALIRQRIIVNTDVTVSEGKHEIVQTALEDDLMNINSTLINAPS